MVIMKYILPVLILLVVFQVWGQAAAGILRFRTKSVVFTEVFGFFVYFGVFQIVALPLILMKKSVTLLSEIWFIVSLAAIAVFLIFFIKKKLWRVWKNRKRSVDLWMVVLAVIAAAALVLLAFYAALQVEESWDSAYYMGTMSTSLYTDTMYQFNGLTGLKEKYLDFRYALSTFYMQTVVLAKWTGLPAYTLQRFVMKPLAIFLSGMVYYLIGMVIFHRDRQKSLYTVLFSVFVNLIFVSEFSSAKFLIVRGYEAKGYCANIVLPAVIFCMLLLWYRKKRKKLWQILFFINFASVPISMSSLLIVPILTALMTLALIVTEKKWKYFLYAFLCCIPNFCYLFVYYLYTERILLIGV